MKRFNSVATSAAALLVAGGFAAPAVSDEITIAMVNNSDMIIMKELSPKWEEATGNSINWVVLEENVLRQRVTTDVATQGGSFDIFNTGLYEVPIWGSKGWLVPLDDFGADYEYDDLFPSVRGGMSVDGKMYAMPFYSESSFTYYRTDLFEKAGIEVPTDTPTFDEFREMVAKVHDPENGVFGTCQRGKAGWGENGAFLTPTINAFGGRWFDMDWNPTIDSPEWNSAISYYVDLMQNYGPPGATSNGHNENRALFADGKCATWIDATSASGTIFGPESSVADVTSFFPAPKQTCEKGITYFWAWVLAIPTGSKNVDVAKDFIEWATSKDYIDLVREEKGVIMVPPGTRLSTYTDEYLEAAVFAEDTRDALLAADPTDNTCEPSPYNGQQFVAIEEFQGIGNYVGQQISAALAGQQTVEEALANGQRFAERELQKSGRLK